MSKLASNRVELARTHASARADKYRYFDVVSVERAETKVCLPSTNFVFSFDALFASRPRDVF